jgi:hypothetical protein
LIRYAIIKRRGGATGRAASSIRSGTSGSSVTSLRYGRFHSDGPRYSPRLLRRVEALTKASGGGRRYAARRHLVLRQCAGVLATVAVKLNVPSGLVCEPEHVYCAPVKPDFVPYVFVKLIGCPPVGVKVPLNLRTT